MRRVRLVVLACLAGCGIRAPAPIDVDALLRTRGPVEGRRDLVIRVTGDPRDIAAHLALAALDERIGRPSEAIDELEAVVALGGLAGVRWNAADRARLARLIAARGRVRLARGAATALADLQRARQLGAEIGDDELRRARIAGAIVALRHSDHEVRDAGRRLLAADAAAERATSPGSSAGQAPSNAADAADPATSPRSSAGRAPSSGAASAAERATSPGSSAGRAPSSGAASAADLATSAGSSAGQAPSSGADDPAPPGGSRAGAAPASATTAGVDASRWLGARPDATAEQRGQFGAWLWQQGARRAAWDELAAWHAAAALPHDPALEDAYLVAARWWTPLDLPGPAGARPGDAHDGAPDVAMRCAFGACAPREIAGDAARERAYLLAPLPPPVRDPADAAAVVVIALHQTLRGEAGWGAAIAARVDLAAFPSPAQRAALPGFARPVIARLIGAAEGDAAPPADGATSDQRLVIAAERVLAGAGAADIAGLADGSPYAAALQAVVAPGAPFPGDARSEAAARHAGAVIAGASLEPLRTIAAAFRRDPAIADRLARDAVAGATDAAATHAALGALFDAIGDPARARAAWQAAVDASPEPRFLRGLAGAQARQGDADAALITATSAAAASGDPAVVWVAIAQSLTGAGRHAQALDAARSAIDLAGPDALAPALDAAIAASRALGRDRQAAQLAARRARIAPTGGALGDGGPTDAGGAVGDRGPTDAGGAVGDRDPTDAVAALDAYRIERSDGGPASDRAIARLWTAARWNPRQVAIRAALLAALPAGDPRRAVVAGELVDLAGDPDPEVGRAAAGALP